MFTFTKKWSSVCFQPFLLGVCRLWFIDSKYLDL